MKAAPAILALAIAAVARGAAAAEVEPGQAVFERWCVHCHGEQVNAPGTLRLGWNRGEARALLTRRTDLGAEYVSQVVRHGLQEMPGFRVTEISRDELDALAAWLARAR